MSEFGGVELTHCSCVLVSDFGGVGLTIGGVTVCVIVMLEFS